MDLGSESVDDNHVKPEPVFHGVEADDGDGVEIRMNGSCANGIGNVAETRAINVGTAQAVDLTLSEGKSPGGGPNPAAKGQGLRKWRRIRRNMVSDGGGNSVDDSSRKRGMSGLEIPVKPRNSPVQIDHNNSEGSVGSVNMSRNAGVADGFGIGGASPDSRIAVGPAFGIGDGFGIGGAYPDSRFAVGPAFAARADSENSEDRSSKSSTAASAPKGRYDLPGLVSQARERNRVKNASTKSWGNSAQCAQPGRGRSESSKKHRGDKVKIEKENSHSSMESDSRSSNFVFMQAAPLSSKGKQSRRSMSQEGENSDEAQASEQHFSEEVQTGYRQENVGEVEDFSLDNLVADLSWEGKGDKKKKHGSFADMDPLAESMLNFQTVQEALQKEVQKFGEIGKEPLSQGDNSVKSSGMPVDLSSGDPEINECNLSDQSGSEKIRQTFSNSLEAQISSLKQHVKLLEDKLDETMARLEVKESRVAELEDIINISKSLKEESGSTIELQEEQFRELEAEVESLFRQKIEAEIEYIVIKRTTQTVKFAAGDQIAIVEEQEAVAGEQARMLNKLGEAEIRAAKLKERTEELGKFRGDIIGTEEVFTMQKRLCKVSSCLFMQLILLVLAVWVFLLQSSPHQGVVVPT